ncbi:hypothetical protein AMTRI_Chr02g265090 [Amborella trichopoda]
MRLNQPPNFHSYKTHPSFFSLSLSLSLCICPNRPFFVLSNLESISLIVTDTVCLVDRACYNRQSLQGQGQGPARSLLCKNNAPNDASNAFFLSWRLKPCSLLW